MRRLLAALVLAMLAAAAPAEGHPAPFSYLDVHVGPDRLDVTVTVHIFDLAHDLPVAKQEHLLDPAFLEGKRAAIAALLGARFRITADQALAPLAWAAAEPLIDRQAIRLRASAGIVATPGIITVEARMFPYDPAHQTFANIYETGTLAAQAILDTTRPGVDYFSGTREGAAAVVRRFTPVGFRHVLLGSDHVTLMFGLLLLGGSRRQRSGILAGLAGGNLMAWTLTWLDVLHPPARIIEPALALGLVYLGADNLLVRGGRDMRAFVALAFGLVHGFWFAIGLRGMDLPSATRSWSLLAFAAGVEAAHLVAMVIVGGIVSLLHRAFPAAAWRVVAVGSVCVMIAGGCWFLQRVFFPAGFL